MDSQTSNKAIIFRKYSFPSKIGDKITLITAAICSYESKQQDFHFIICPLQFST